MRLKSIEIRNFRLLRRVVVDLATDSASTILVGPNNSGKTSVMDAIRLFSRDDRKRLRIHDFALSRRSAFILAEERLVLALNDEDRIRILQRYLPIIRISMTFEYTDTPADLSIVAALLMDLEPENNEVTARIEFSISNALELWGAFRDRRNPEETTLFDVIAENLHDYYGLFFSKVSADGREAQRLADGSPISRLIRVDMISAQRHIDDEEGGKSEKLSRLLHAHYSTYIRENDQEGFQAIEDAIVSSAEALTEEYQRAFERLFTRLREFGYPQGSAKPELLIKAEMSSETIYRDNAKIYYSSPSKKGQKDAELPEEYNGLGYKNLIYLMLKIETFRAAVEADPAHRPGVHLIGIEEPEVHLHPQMQSVFIKEISKPLESGESLSTQVMLSTHSPHMVADSGFIPIRYFQRRDAEAFVKDLSRLALSLSSSNTNTAENTTLTFLRRYFKLTHCDLLFADKAVLVEGQVERLLLPAMIEQVGKQEGFEGFASQYCTVLEIGGAYAHKIEPVLSFIGIPTLIIADIDSATEDRKKCPVADGKITTNAVLKYWLPQHLSLDDLHKATDEARTIGTYRIVYQTKENDRCGRSFEEAFVYSNLQWIAENTDRFVGTKFHVEQAIKNGLADAAYDFGSKVNKVDLALDLMVAEGWSTPAYIEEGLKWLALCGSYE